MPHVHVMGDLSEIQAYRLHTDFPDQFDPSLTAYRKLRGFVKRTLAGGAWSVAQFIRAALGDVWKCDATWHGHIRNLSLERHNDWRALAHIFPTPETLDSFDIVMDDFKATDNLTFEAHLSEQQYQQAENTRFSRALSDESYNKHIEIRSDIPPSKGHQNSAASYAFDGGVTVTEIAPEPKPNQPFQEPTDFEHIRPWILPLTLWPLGETIRVAIRYVDLTPHLKEPKTSQAIWDELPPDARQPLETFFKFTDNDISRIVVLVDHKWCHSNEMPRANLLSDTPVDMDLNRAFVLISPRRKDWMVWSSGCTVVTADRPEVAVETSRLRIDFKSPYPNLFGFFAPSSIVTLFQPPKRPANDIQSPLAVVTTSQLVDDEIPDEPAVLRPVWQAALYSSAKDSHGIIRFREAYGYDWPNDWLRRTYASYCEWVKALNVPLGRTNPFLNDTTDQQLLRIIDWGISRYHRHGDFVPEWAPLGVMSNEHEFQHLVLIDLNYGFRKYSTSGGPLQELSCSHVESTRSAAMESTPLDHRDASEAHDAVRPSVVCDSFLRDLGTPRLSEAIRPDWWHPLRKWATHSRRAPSLKERGWIVAILGRQLPLLEAEWCEGNDLWDRGDLWELLRHTSVRDKDGSHPLFCDRTVVILSGNMMRASGARISHRLSWEHTAVDCIRELESNPRFKPLLDFRHLIVRFGCTGAIHATRYASPGSTGSPMFTLFYDATAKDGFHRDLTRSGQVIGANSVFAGTILKRLIQKSPSLGPHATETDCVHEGIRHAIVDCQKLYDQGYGASFDDLDSNPIEYLAPQSVLFEPYF